MKRRHMLQAMGAAGLAPIVSSNSAAASPAASDFRQLDPDKSLRVGMIGEDGHTSYVTNGLKYTPNAKLVAWAKGGPEGASSSDRRSSQAGAPVYDDYREMFDKEQLDIVGICLPYAWNTRAAIEAARRGVHMMIEKPSAVSLEDLESLQQAVTRNRVRSTLMLEMRLSRPVQAIKQAIVAGRIGAPATVTSQKTYKFGASRPEFYKDRAVYGGTIPWVAVHAVDYMQYVTGLQYTHVSAFHTNLAHPEYATLEDAGGILLRLSNGGSALCNFDYLRPDGAPSHGDNRLRVTGTRGVVEMIDFDDPDKVRVVLIEGENPPELLPLPEEQHLFPDFVSELRGSGTHVLTQDECFRITRVVLLARQAADTGTMLKI